MPLFTNLSWNTKLTGALTEEGANPFTVDARRRITDGTFMVDLRSRRGGVSRVIDNGSLIDVIKQFHISSTWKFLNEDIYPN